MNDMFSEVVRKDGFEFAVALLNGGGKIPDSLATLGFLERRS